MEKRIRETIDALLAAHEVMTIATVRADGYPQATAVQYANDGLTLYFACAPQTQKVKNLAFSPKVSLTINTEDWMHIKGLSMGGEARVITNPRELEHAVATLLRRFPALTREQLSHAAVVRVDPRVISVIDYGLGWGHTDLIEVPEVLVF